MRIVSNFHDYYDGVRGYGSDPRLVYVRETKEIEKPAPEIIDPLYVIAAKMPHWDHGGHGVIAFCGRAFPFYEYRSTTVYSLQDLIRAVATIPIPSDSPQNTKALLESLSGKTRFKREWKYRNIYYYGGINQSSWDLFVKNVDLSLDDDFFRTIEAPVALIEPGPHHYRDLPLVVNPRLNKYNFASQRDPYTAYQELSMFLGNNMATQKDPEVHISDKLRAENHGFDKWSFRKRPKG
jgi:hypothetical protein